MKGRNEYHIKSHGGGIYYLDNLGLLWHESLIPDKPISRQKRLLYIKFIAKIKITIK